MKVAIYPGSFDPFTLGHLDMAERIAKLFDMVYVAVLHNSAKTPIFAMENRVEMATLALSGIPNVVVESYEGLLADYAVSKNAVAVARGVRSFTDYESERFFASANSALGRGSFETVLVMANPALNHVTSSVVREVLIYGGEIKELVPDAIYGIIKEKYRESAGRRG